MNEAELIERLRSPVFGTPTALDAAAAIETWKARAERMADLHRDMCVENGRLEAELLSLRRKVEELGEALVIANAQLADMEFLSVDGFMGWKQDRRALRAVDGGGR